MDPAELIALLDANGSILGFLLLSFILGNWNFSVLWIVLLCLGWLFHEYRTKTAVLRRAAAQMERQLHSEAALRKELANRGWGLPPWITFPDVERVSWLNNMVAAMWPKLAAATEESIEYSVQPLLDYYRPGFLTVLKFHTLDLGPTPLLLSGIQTVRGTADEVLLDIHFTFAGQPRISIVAGTGPVTMLVSVNDLQLSGVMRVVFSPLVDAFPCFSALSISFLEKPSMEFSLTTAKLPLSMIPGFAEWLTSFIKDVAFSWMVWPQRLPIPILDMDDVELARLLRTHPKGVLTIKVCQAKNLKNNELIGKSDTFCQVKMAEETDKTAVAKNTQNPQWLHEMRLRAFHPPTDTVTLTVCDTDFVPGGNDMIGTAQFALSTLQPGVMKTLWLDLSKRGVIVSKNGRAYGKVQVQATWEPFTAEELNARVADEAKEIKRQREIAELRAQGKYVEEDAAAAAGSGADGAKRASRKGRGKDGRPNALHVEPRNPGTLKVELLDAAGLSAADSNGLSDPFVVFNLGAEECKSSVVKKSLDPVWKDQVFRLSVADCQVQDLELTVLDWDRFGDNDVLGIASVPLSSLAGSKATEVTVPLSEGRSGKVRLRLTLKLSAGAAGGLSGGAVMLAAATTSSAPKKISQSKKAAAAAAAEAAASDAGEGILRVTVVAAHHLTKTDFRGKTDPYVRLVAGESAAQTTVKKKTLDPEWDERLELIVSDRAHASVDAELWDWERVGQDELVSKASHPLAGLEPNAEEKVTLSFGPDGCKGTLDLRMVWLPFSGDGAGGDGSDEDEDEEEKEEGGGGGGGGGDSKAEAAAAGGDGQAPAPAMAGANESRYSLHEDEMTDESVAGDLSIAEEDEDEVDPDADAPSLTPRRDEKKQQRRYSGLLKVVVKGARDLPEEENVYVKLRTAQGGEKRTTKVVRRSERPTWNEEFRFAVSNSLAEEVSIRVRRHRSILADVDIGAVRLAVRDLVAEAERDSDAAGGDGTDGGALPPLNVEREWKLEGGATGLVSLKVTFHRQIE